MGPVPEIGKLALFDKRAKAVFPHDYVLFWWRERVPTLLDIMCMVSQNEFARKNGNGSLLRDKNASFIRAERTRLFS